MEFLGTTGRKTRHSGSLPRAQCYERIEYYPVDLQALAECALARAVSHLPYTARPDISFQITHVAGVMEMHESRNWQPIETAPRDGKTFKEIAAEMGVSRGIRDDDGRSGRKLSSNTRQRNEILGSATLGGLYYGGSGGNGLPFNSIIQANVHQSIRSRGRAAAGGISRE